MIEYLELFKFRRFEHFKLERLGRVNLLVGRNNSGKTSILEAIEILESGGRSDRLFAGLKRRREVLWVQTDDEWKSRYDARRLFHGHRVDRLAIEASSGHLSMALGEREVHEYGPDPWPEDIPSEEISEASRVSAVQCKFIGLSGSDGIVLHEGHGKYLRRLEIGPIGPTAPLHFLSTRAMAHDELVLSYGEIALTAEENTILEALRLLEPKIERMAVVSPRSNGGDRPAVLDNELFVKIEGVDQRVPLGSLGDGIGRVLGLVLALVDAKGGILLVDEIDTGLHYTTLETVWDLLFQMAERLEVQIFATTHSDDCWRALARVIANRGIENVSASIQRIEKDASRAVAFDAEEIVAAAEHHVEVR